MHAFHPPFPREDASFLESSVNRRRPALGLMVPLGMDGDKDFTEEETGPVFVPADLLRAAGRGGCVSGHRSQPLVCCQPFRKRGLLGMD